MAWWNGEGAARVLRYQDNALIMEHATGTASLAEMARFSPSQIETNTTMNRSISWGYAPSHEIDG